MHKPLFVKVKDLAFERNEIYLFQGLTFTVAEGGLLQVCGANGCGKTTLLRLLSGFISPSQGKIIKPISFQYLGHQHGLKSYLNVYENLHLFALLMGFNTFCVHKVIETSGLSHLKYTAIHALSAGEKQKVALVKLLLCRTELWILDEPLTALDAKNEAWLHHVFNDHLTQGGMIITATHKKFNLRCKTLDLDNF